MNLTGEKRPVICSAGTDFEGEVFVCLIVLVFDKKWGKAGKFLGSDSIICREQCNGLLETLSRIFEGTKYLFQDYFKTTY